MPRKHVTREELDQQIKGALPQATVMCMLMRQYMPTISHAPLKIIIPALVDCLGLSVRCIWLTPLRAHRVSGAMLCVCGPDSSNACAGADQFESFVLSLISMIWFDRVYHLPTEELNTLEPVYASELYPDIKLKTVEEYYKEHA